MSIYTYKVAVELSVQAKTADNARECVRMTLNRKSIDGEIIAIKQVVSPLDRFKDAQRAFFASCGAFSEFKPPKDVTMAYLDAAVNAQLANQISAEQLNDAWQQIKAALKG